LLTRLANVFHATAAQRHHLFDAAAHAALGDRRLRLAGAGVAAALQRRALVAVRAAGHARQAAAGRRRHPQGPYLSPVVELFIAHARAVTKEMRGGSRSLRAR
jgi:hypothetical protein